MGANGVRVEVPAPAVAAGATIINDVSAELWPVAAATGAAWVAMHMPADPTVMQQHAHYDDVVTGVRAPPPQKTARAS